jgi:hypothetical protein
MAELTPIPPAVIRGIDMEPFGDRVAPTAPAVRVKAGARTVRVNVWLRVTPPPAADRVTVETPALAAVPAVSVKVLELLPGATMLPREKLAVTPFGTPLSEKDTAELNPVPAVVVTVNDPEPPRLTVMLAAFAVSVKAEAVTASVMV